MKVVSRIMDKRINAENVLFEVSVEEYVSVATEILEKNEFQRKRVKGSQTVYSLLKNDMRKGCTIPPIVVAVKIDELKNVINASSITNEQLEKLFEGKKLLILDGLQRTNTLLDLVGELRASNSEELKSVLKNTLRVEMYVGLNKISILYRMLTLNTGQTPMSMRHQVEILYSDYLGQEFAGIRLFRETDTGNPQGIGDYKFNEVVEGFNAYLERDPLALTRSDVLENIKNLESLSEEKSTDLFTDYIVAYNELIKRIDGLIPDWEVDESTLPWLENQKGNKVFGKNLRQIFSRPQSMSGFGAAIGKLKELEVLDGLTEASKLIGTVKFEADAANAMDSLLQKMFYIQMNARKIGNEQRFFFMYLFRELFNRNSDSYLTIDRAIESGFKVYRSIV
jgi:hypothetical protein